MRFVLLFARALLTLGIVFAAMGALAAEPRAGVDYDLLPNVMPTEVPGKIEVIEFFWYHCPHCYEIQPLVKAWREKLPKDVNFRVVHVNWAGRNDLEPHARLYLTLKAMGTLDANHDAVFDAIFKDNIELRDEDKLYAWVAKRGMDKAKFQAIWKSFGVQSQLTQLQKTSSDYRIDGTPTFIVNGKYKASPSKSGGLEKVFSDIDGLIAKERAGAKVGSSTKTSKPAA